MPEVPMPDAPPKGRTRKAKTTGTTDPTDTRGNGGNGGAAKAEAPGAAPRAAATPRPRARAASLESRLTEFLGMASIPFALQGDMYCAQVLATRTPDLARNLAALADENPGIKRVLNKMMEGSAWGGVALSVVAIAVPIAQHHNLLPGADPFAAQYPPLPQAQAIQSPPAGFNGWSQPTDDRSTMGAPASAPQPTDEANDGAPDMTRVPGAPPGVVTVAATSAGHTGAR